MQESNWGPLKVAVSAQIGPRREAGELLVGTEEKSVSPTRGYFLPSLQINNFWPIWPPQNLIACDLQFRLQYDPDYHQDENDKPTLNETYTCAVCIVGFLADNTESPGAELHSDFLALQGG